MYNYNQNPYNFNMSNAQNQNSIQYVNGMESARAYNLPPNSNVILMDSTQDVFYVKTTDASGFANIKAFEFKAVEEKKTDYVTREEFDKFLNDLKERMKSDESVVEK